jgi:cardiolipin synthase
MGTFFLVLAISGILIQLLLLLLALFGPGLPYRIHEPPRAPLDSEDFARLLGGLSDSAPHCDTSVQVLTNGDVFYEAELDAIRAATSHVCLEAYIFQKGEIGGRFIEALTERARAGVEVRVVLDAVGSFNTWKHTFRELIDAGGQVRWYMPFRWYNLTSYNNRTHREMLIVDGRVGFLGGAGIADHWYKQRGKNRRWRDTMFRIEGRAATAIQSLFAENWLESSGELLASMRYYPDTRASGSFAAMVVHSSPSQGRATRARMLFQTLLASAQRTIHITTPYFLPDRYLREELVRAIERRGVEVKVIVPGKHSDHLLTRRSSRRIYGHLLRHGAHIFEYAPSMIHTKSLVVDGIWSVVGSTNFDSRSFGLNDEVNLAALDEALAVRLEEDFARDLAVSKNVTYDEWRRRSPIERVNEWLGWIIERQE